MKSRWGWVCFKISIFFEETLGGFFLMHMKILLHGKGISGTLAFFAELVGFGMVHVDG